ncbi:MAG: hypothetical protein L3J49_05435, partial [Desulfobulbaceae bacterium]|nr:hypothetical protein [Desulfobulbaceae bacterium]
MNILNYLRLALIISLFFYSGCAQTIKRSGQGIPGEAPPEASESVEGAVDSDAHQEEAREAASDSSVGQDHDGVFIPGVKWVPSYRLKDVAIKETTTGLPRLKV